MHAGQLRLWTHAQGGAAAHRARMVGRSVRLQKLHGLHSQHEVLQPPRRSIGSIIGSIGSRLQ